MADHSRQLCERCAERKARYQYRGAVRADRHHTLCFQCFRSMRERLRARGLLDGAHAPSPATPVADAPFLPAGPVLTATLSAAQRSHRLRMLRHLESARASGVRRPSHGPVEPRR